MDLCMPVMGGLEATEAILSQGCTCKIIGISADSSEEQLDSAIEAGMYSLMKKPIKLDMLKGYI